MGSVIVARHARYCLLIELVFQVFSWVMYLTLVTFCLFSFPPSSQQPAPQAEAARCVRDAISEIPPGVERCDICAARPV